MGKRELSSACDTPLSVIIPVHQLSIRMTSLVKILDSAIGLNIEIVLVVDSASSSETLQLQNEVRKFDGADIKIVHGIFGSAGYARNAGLKVCKCKWITFWDSDDIPNPSKYLRVLENEDVWSYDLLVGAIQETRMNSEETPRIHFPTSAARTIAKYPGFTRFLYRSDYIQELQFKSHKMGEDICFLSDVLSKQPRTKYLNELLYEYQVGRSFQTTQLQGNFKDLLKVVNHLIENSRKYPFSYDLNQQFALRTYAGYLKHNRNFLNAQFLWTSFSLLGLLLRKIRIRAFVSTPTSKAAEGDVHA